MSSAFEQWQRAKARREQAAYLIARTVATGKAPFAGDIEVFKQAEAQMRELETKFSEES